MPTRTKRKQPMRLADLLFQKICALYDIEREIAKGLLKLAKAAKYPELREAFQSHLKETHGQIERLEKVFFLIGKRPKRLAVEAVRGLAEDASWIIKNVTPVAARDANLCRAAQYVEHYEMAGYYAAIAWAEELGQREIADLLGKNLREEIAADEKLSRIGPKIDKKLV